LIVRDCAPTDATLRLVTLPDVAQKSLRVLLPLVRMLAGVTAPIARRLVEVPLPDARVFGDVDELVNRQLRPLAERLTDRQTSVRLVVTPERMVIDESRRAWTELALFDVGCDAIVLNRVLPPEAGREDFFRDWMRVQEDRRREVEALFAPHPVLCAPMRSDEVTGLERLATHGEALFAGVEPEAVLSTAPRVVFRRDGDAYLAVVPLPGADPAQLEVAKVEDELTITTGLRRRSLKLPRRMASLVLEAARLDGTSLKVRLRRAGTT
jgi:arsenite-transporting ATPase